MISRGRSLDCEFTYSLQPSFYAALETERLRSMPNSWLPPSSNRQAGLIMLGDALNMRHPLTGGGMTVAFWDVVHLRSLLSKQKVMDFADTKSVTKTMKALHWKRKSRSSVINILAQALYDLFSAGDSTQFDFSIGNLANLAGLDKYMKILQDGCFGYFQLGGRCISTPTGLLAGYVLSSSLLPVISHVLACRIIPEPMTLVGHFFAVAFYGCWLVLKSNPIYMLPVSFWQSIVAIWTAAVVIGPVMLAEIKP